MKDERQPISSHKKGYQREGSDEGKARILKKPELTETCSPYLKKKGGAFTEGRRLVGRKQIRWNRVSELEKI